MRRHIVILLNYIKMLKEVRINGLKLMRFQLDIWETFLAVKWLIELLGEATIAPSMEVFKNRLSKPLPRLVLF